MTFLSFVSLSLGAEQHDLPGMPPQLAMADMARGVRYHCSTARPVRRLA
jgi:hypothetical protein